MKSCLVLLNLVLLSYTAAAQVPDSATGRRRLDRENGLWGIKFGTPLRRFHGLEDHSSIGYWSSPHEEHKLGPYALKSVHYRFTYDKGKVRLFSFDIRFADTTAIADKVLQLLRARYGPPDYRTSNRWTSAHIRVQYWGGRTVGTSNGRVIITNTTMKTIIYNTR